jgi:hypothetical protein
MPDEAPGNQRDFGVIEHIALRQELLVLGHAIGAAEIAPVGDRNPQIIDLAAKSILHEHHL